MGTDRLRVVACAMLVLLAGSVLALAWLDWAYPGLVAAWWRGERIYRVFWLRLAWAVGIAGSVSVLLWWMSTHARRDARPNLVHATAPFSLAFLAPLFFARYFFHPFGVQPGSSIWAYGLTAVTVGVLTWPLYRLWAAWRQSPVLLRWGWPVVCGVAVIYVSLFCFLSVARQDAFRAHALDLGTMDQAAWNTIQGRVLERTPLYRDPAAGSRYENRLLDAKLEEVGDQLSQLKARLAEVQRRLIVLKDTDVEIEWVKSCLTGFDRVWDTLSSENRGRLVRAIVERVEVDEPNGDVRAFLADLGPALKADANNAEGIS